MEHRRDSQDYKGTSLKCYTILPPSVQTTLTQSNRTLAELFPRRVNIMNCKLLVHFITDPLLKVPLYPRSGFNISLL